MKFPVKPWMTLIWCLITLPQIVASPLPLITNVPNRTTLSLNGDWHYIIDPYQNGYYDYRRIPFDQNPEPGTGAYYVNAKTTSKSNRVEYDFDLSPTMQVPGAWGTQVPELTWYEGTVWYERGFTLNKLQGKRYFIYFGAINYEAHVWVNGKKLGTHIGGFTPFNFEATDVLESGDNFIVVMADNARHEEAIPTVATDWWNHGGITRSVSIVELPETYVQDYQIQLSKNGEEVVGFVQLDKPTDGNEIEIRIPEANLEQSLKTNESGKAVFSLDAGSLKRWGLNSPKLYDVEIRTAQEVVKDRIGFRTIETKGQDILLNGKKVFLRGISMHEENPMDGTRNNSLADVRRMFSWVQELKANFVRLAHYPHNEHMPRLADELGILLWEEIPVYWTIQWENPETLQNAKNQLAEMITRDRNRASVIIWSMANETPVSESRNQFLGKLVETARSLDDTRLISAAMEVHQEGNTKIMSDPFGTLTDITSFNQYHGWYGGDRDDFPNLEWDIHYSKPVIVSEWGAGAKYGFHADKDTMWSEEYQEYLYQKTLEGIFNIPGLSGMTPWILADFRSPRRALPGIQDMWNRKGIISEGGHKKKAFYILCDFYADPDLEKR
jgi:beta-glucuronidase